MKISRQYVDEIIHASTREQLLPYVQKFIELEHATIPPYLCGYFTIKQGGNALAAEVIRSVVVEEMLHMTIACNLMNALGGEPSIDGPHFVPDYPHQLPFGIGDHFQVHLRKCSVAQVRDTFMKIEEPEKPIEIPVGAPMEMMMEVMGAMDDDDLTIGTLYAALASKLTELEDAAQKKGKTIFVGHKGRQVVPLKWFTNPEEIFPIENLHDALKGIKVIVDQGEGTTHDPFDGFGEPAHFYRFEQIVEGKELVPRPGEKPPYAYAGNEVVLHESEVLNMDDDPKVAKYKEGSFSRRLATQFNYNYTKLLRSLHDTFNGNPDGIDRSMGVMYELRFAAYQALTTQAEWADPTNTTVKQTGLSFEYESTNPV